MEIRAALTQDGSVRLVEESNGGKGVYSKRILGTWTPQELAELQTLHSSLVEGVKKLVATCRAESTERNALWSAESRRVFGELADELSALLAQTGNENG